MSDWDARQYLQFEAERTRPAADLLARVAGAARRVVDLGCGPGNSTELVAARFPDAEVTGIDNSEDMLANLHFTKKLGLQSRDALLAGDLHSFAELMAAHWEHKKGRSPGMTNGPIDQLYGLARANGALGGKLVGAGGGGFLMLYTEEKTRLRRVMREAGLREVRLQFDFGGTTVVAHS